jgi:serine/threonine protein kinase
MKQNLNLLASFSPGKLARLCLLVGFFGMAGHSCIAADGKRPDERGSSAGKPFVAGPDAAILPDIPLIDWRDLTQGRLIGRGGFGDVYEGQWKGQDVAIKKLHMHALPNAAVKRDFDAEVRVMWSSQYPRILRLYGVTEAGNCAMVMERMQRSLHDLIHSEEEIPEGKRVQIAIDIAQGLASLHSQNIVHRDLKSQNILLGKGDRGKISDFGLAKIRVHTKSTTKLGGASGTVRWGAPEVFSLRPQTTPASDMYSYGMVLWELLTRKVPFAEQPDDTIVLAAVKGGEREEIPEGCGPVWQEVIKGCWEQDPGKRPTATEVLARFMTLKPPQRPQWLPAEDFQAPLRVEGYACQLASQGDWDLVLRSYARYPVPGYDVGRVEVIFNPKMNEAFKARRDLLQQREGKPRFAASWQQNPDGGARAEVARRLEVLTDPWQDEDYPGIKLMPLWHGTQRNNLGSLLSTGYGPFGDTDDGYFGKGIYATFEAAYAQMYADKFAPPNVGNGVLIFNWGITYNSRPIIKSDYNPYSKRLAWTPDIAKYDSHFVPVVHLKQADYIPVMPPEAHQFTEMVFFDGSQVLPRYLVTLQPTVSHSPVIPLSQMFATLEALKGQRREQEQGGNIAALKKQLEVLKRELEHSQSAEQQASERIGDVNKRLENFQREAGEYRQQIEALKGQLAAEKEKEEARAKQLAIMEREKLRAAEEEKRIAALRPAIPPVAYGYEAIYQRFLNGALIYTDPQSRNQITLPIKELANPLEGTFNLSLCGDTGKYLSIATGYRKGKKPENTSKVEIWFAPRFLIEKELNSTAAHFKPIMGNWKQEAPVGMFWTWGGWDDMGWYDYLTNESMENLSKIDLYENYKKSSLWFVGRRSGRGWDKWSTVFMFRL